MKTIVAGSRGFNNYDLLCNELNDWNQFGAEITEIVSGTAQGADKLGEQFAKEYHFPIKQFPANWQEFGKSAGYIRNKQMADYAEVLIAFWDGKSKGTKHMIDLANQNELIVHIVKY